MSSFAARPSGRNRSPASIAVGPRGPMTVPVWKLVQEPSRLCRNAEHRIACAETAESDPTKAAAANRILKITDAPLDVYRRNAVRTDTLARPSRFNPDRL